MVSSILIDFDNIVKPNKLKLLESLVQPIPKTKFSLGLVLVVNEKEHVALNSIQKGKNRVNYINSISFINSISGHAFTIYDKKKRICEIIGLRGLVLDEILNTILTYIPNDVTIWVGIQLDESYTYRIINQYIKAGFHNPYISKQSPLGFVFSSYGLCMLRENNIVVQVSDATDEVKYVLEQFTHKNKQYCRMRIRLSPSAVEYLRKISSIGSTDNTNGKITQKELAGRLLVSHVDRTTENELIHNLIVDYDSILIGQEEGVNIEGSLYNFHSHPKEAYDTNKVHLAWPSAQDYVGFISSSIKYDSILHIVASIEGCYVISLSRYTVNIKENIDSDILKFILENYDIRCKNDETVLSYINTVNNILYKGNKLFITQFFPWNEAYSEFTIPFSKIGINCFTSQYTLDKYQSFLIV